MRSHRLVDTEEEQYHGELAWRIVAGEKIAMSFIEGILSAMA
jgi:hypothetical protein